MQSPIPAPLSWRDPDGFVVNHEGRILRAVNSDKAAQFERLIGQSWIAELVAQGSIPHTTRFLGTPPGTDHADKHVWFEHTKLVFPCYPHEICALQLYDSAQLTLRIALLAAQNGWSLKDASAWNVLHDGGRPVFVDLLSFEKRNDASAWAAYGQFVRHFLLTLMIHRKLGMTPGDIFLQHRDGITPERAYELLRGSSLLSTAAIEFVVLPRWLASAGARKISSDVTRPQKPHAGPAGLDPMVLTLQRLQRRLTSLRPSLSGTSSVWKEYEEERVHYSQADLEAKKAFVLEHLESGGSALDLGCNAGEFSILAVERGNSVVAADFDHGALSRLYGRVREKNIPVTPLMLNIARPTPAIGWENREVDGFLQRAAGRFNCILMLGLIHHLLVSERCTLPMLIDLLCRLAPRSMILEWVAPSDPRFRQVAGLNHGLYESLDAGVFEAALSSKFQLQAKLVLPCTTRVMYLYSNCNIPSGGTCGRPI